MKRISVFGLLWILPLAVSAGDADESQIAPETIAASRSVSRTLFKLHREERAIVEASALPALLTEVRNLQGSLRPQPLSVRAVAPQEMGGHRAVVLPNSAVLQTQKMEVLGVTDRIDTACTQLEAEIEAIPSPRQRSVARQALAKARAIRDQTRTAYASGVTANVEALQSLREHAGTQGNYVAEGVGDLQYDDPNLRTRLKHRRTSLRKK